MKTLCIVPCGKLKIWKKHPLLGPTPAKLVYIGPFAKKMQDYAKHFHEKSYVIISAKYGFLFPDDLIEDYDVSFNDPATNPIGLDELKEIVIDKHLLEYDRIIIVAPKLYAEISKKVFMGKEVLTPLSNCKNMFQMMEIVSKAITTNTPLVDY